MSARVKPNPEKVVQPAPARRGRGRPRSSAAMQAILRAARELLAEGGPAAVTMEGVAARAGVGKPTLYRWWPDRHAVTMAALMSDAEPEATAKQPAKDAIASLRKQLRNIAERFATREGRHVASLIAASDSDTELSKAFRNHFVLARRQEGHALLQQAIAAGEIRADVDIEVVLDLLYGPLFFRLLMGHAPLDLSFSDRLLQHALHGLRPAAKKRR